MRPSDCSQRGGGTWVPSCKQRLPPPPSQRVTGAAACPLVAHDLRYSAAGGRDMSDIASHSSPTAHAVLPPLSFPARACLALVKPFVDGPLRRFNARLRPVGQRYQSTELYEADRLESLDEYRELLHPHCAFAGKTVVELGCSEGYLLEAFLGHESFDAIGVDIDPDPLAIGTARRGGAMRFVQSTVDSIPLPDESADAIYS